MYISRKTPIDFGVKRWLVNIMGQGTCSYIRPQICFQRKTLVWIIQLQSDFTSVPLITQGRFHIDLGVKRSKAKVTGEDCLQTCLRMITPDRINELFPYFT